MSDDKAALLACIAGIEYTEGGTNTAEAIALAGTHLNATSSLSRNRVIEGALAWPSQACAFACPFTSAGEVLQIVLRLCSSTVTHRPPCCMQWC